MRQKEAQSRDLRFCVAQMAKWSPFGSEVGVRDCQAQQIARCNSAAAFSTELTDALVRVQIGERSVSCPSLNGNLNATMSDHDEDGCCNEMRAFSRRHKLLGGDSAVVGSKTQDLNCPFPQVISGTRETALEKDYAIRSPSLGNRHSVSNPEARWKMFSTAVSVCAYAAGQSTIREVQVGRKRIGSWSKRRKQISHVFLRGLWRWKEGAHARKRRKRAAVGCSCSGSGARSCYTSDPPTGYAKSVTGTDSSGELFFGFPPVSQVSWSTDFSTAAMDRGLARDPTGGGDYLASLRVAQNDVHTTESGYTSEPDYSADSEFKCNGDFPADAEDEEDKEPFQLVVWKEMIAGNGRGVPQKPQVTQDCVVELFYGKEPPIRRLHSRIRQRRRSWRTIELCKSR